MILYASGKFKVGKHFHFFVSFCLSALDINRSLLSASFNEILFTFINT